MHIFNLYNTTSRVSARASSFFSLLGKLSHQLIRQKAMGLKSWWIMYMCRCSHTPLSYMCRCKLQALIYDILLSTTAPFSYVIGSWKLSAKEQFFVGAQTAVSLLQTTEIKQGVSFIAANKVYTSTNKTTIIWIETELLFFTQGGFTWALGCFHSLISTQTFWRALTTSVDSCAEIKSAPSVA